jgi:hypothetical protein
VQGGNAAEPYLHRGEFLATVDCPRPGAAEREGRIHGVDPNFAS